MVGADILSIAKGGKFWNLFVFVLLAVVWIWQGNNNAIRFEQHVMESEKRTTEALQSLSAELEKIEDEMIRVRGDMRQDIRYLTGRIDFLIQTNGH